MAWDLEELKNDLKKTEIERRKIISTREKTKLLNGLSDVKSKQD